jgi:histidinol-phosphate aminotransferase
MKFYKKKMVNRVRIAPPAIDSMVEMHRNISPDILSSGSFNDFLITLKKSDLDKYPEIDPLIEKIASHHDINKENVMITSGIDGGLKSIFEMCSTVGDNIATYYPSYTMYDVYVEMYALKMVPIVIDKETLAVTKEDILKVLDNDIGVLFLANPNMPIETSFNINEIEEITKKARQKETLVVIDEAYALFGCDTSVPLINKYENILVARTFSKAMGIPGIRLGYILGNSELVSYLQSRRFAHESNALTVAAGIWALDNFEIIMQIKDSVIKTREWFKMELKSIGINCYGSLSNTVIIDLKNQDEVVRFSSALKQDGYLIKSNYPVGYENFSSITIGENSLMKNVLSSIKRYYLS